MRSQLTAHPGLVCLLCRLFYEVQLLGSVQGHRPFLLYSHFLLIEAIAQEFCGYDCWPQGGPALPQRHHS